MVDCRTAAVGLESLNGRPSLLATGETQSRQSLSDRALQLQTFVHVKNSNLIANLNDALARCRSCDERCVSVGYAVQIEPSRIDLWYKSTALDQCVSVAQDFAAMRTPLAGEQRHEGEDAGIAGRLERQRRERVRIPAKRAYDMTEAMRRDRAANYLNELSIRVRCTPAQHSIALHPIRSPQLIAGVGRNVRTISNVSQISLLSQ